MKTRKSKILRLMLIVCAGCAITGCTKDPKTTKTTTTKNYIYCINQDQNALKKIEYKTEDAVSGEKSEEDLIREADSILGELEKQPEEKGCTPVIPLQISILDLTMDGKTLVVDVSNGYQDISITEQVLFRAGVVKSITTIDGIYHVRFLVAGEEMVDLNGDPIGTLEPSDFVENAGAHVRSYKVTQITLYYTDHDYDELVSETRNVRYNTNTSMEKMILEELIKGPKKAGHQRILPADIGVLAVSVKDQICYINFDESLLQLATEADDIHPKLMVNAIANSIISSTNVTKVQLLVNGRSNVTLYGGVSLEEPFERNSEIMEADD